MRGVAMAGCAVVAAFGAEAVVAATFDGAPTPTLMVDSYKVRVEATRVPADLWTIAPDRFRLRTLGAGVPPSVGREGTETTGPYSTAPRFTGVRNAYYGEPDAFPRTPGFFSGSVAAMLAGARSGAAVFRAENLAGSPALRADIVIAANECAGEGKKNVRVWLSRATLLPLKVVERDAATRRITRATTLKYSSVNAAFPDATFRPPPAAASLRRTNQGFQRATPAAADAALSYPVKVPALLPPGFVTDVVGWAARGRVVGAEGSIPADRSLFSATYRRGQEYITVTQRAASQAWPDDPFGAECVPLKTEPATVGAFAATYGASPSITPHLFWWDGAVRHTVSGPFPKTDLVAIAESLAPPR
jgi:hypothetical protein